MFPEDSSAAKVSSLTKNPPSGGIPLIEKSRNAKTLARRGSLTRSDASAAR